MNAGESAFLRTRNAGKLAISKRSGGPRSEAGKAVSSKNSIKTGIYSTQIVLLGETQEEFNELERCFFEDFRPEGVAESQMVHDLAVIAWKKRRLTKIEHAVLMSRLQAPILAEELFEAGLPRREEFKWALENLDCLTQENLAFYERNALLVKGLGRKEGRTQKIAEIEQQEPDLYERLCRMADEVVEANNQNNFDDIGMDLSFHMALTVNSGSSTDDLIESLAAYLERKIRQQADGLRYAIDHMDKINDVRQIVRDKRHLVLVGEDGQSRAMDDLNRAFYRTLKELRTHQEWGRRHRVIDVSPE